ncbi:unnamed protein product [Caenorhabditis brenneri]
MLKTLVFAVFLGYCTYFVYSQATCMDNLINCPEEASHCNDYFYQQSCPLTCKVCKNPPDGCFDTNTQCAISITACTLPQIYSQCNSTCGRCSGSHCVDHLSECPMYSKPCSPAVSAQCPLTCGVCSTSTVPTKAPTTLSTTTTTTTTTTVPPTTTTTKTTTTVIPTTIVVKTTVAPTTVPKTTVKPTVHPTTKKPVPTTPKPPCKDASPNCPTWAKNGFCTNTFYPPEQRKQYCAKTCKFC